MQYRELIDAVRTTGQIGHPQDAERALRATLLALGESGAPVERLAPALPPEVSGYLLATEPGRRRTPVRDPEMNEAERRLAAGGSHRPDAGAPSLREDVHTRRTDPAAWRSGPVDEAKGEQGPRQVHGAAGDAQRPSEPRYADGREAQIRHRDHYQRAVVDEEPTGAPAGLQPGSRATETFIERVAAREGGVPLSEAERHVRAVFGALGQAVDRALLRDVCAGVPGLTPLWPRH